MSENIETDATDEVIETDESEVTTDEVEVEIEAVTEEAEEASKWKALSRKNEKSFKEASALLEEKETSLKTALEELQTLKREAKINELVAQYGIPQNSIALITAQEEAELEVQAKLIAEMLTPQQQQQQVIRSQGSNTLAITPVTRTEEVAEFLRN